MMNYDITEFLNWCQDNTRYTRDEAAIALRDLYVMRYYAPGHLFCHEDCETVHFEEFKFVDVIIDYINQEFYQGELITDRYGIEQELQYKAAKLLDQNDMEVDLDKLEDLIDFRKKINYNTDVLNTGTYGFLGQIISIEDLIKNDFDDFTRLNASNISNMDAAEFELYMNIADE